MSPSTTLEDIAELLDGSEESEGPEPIEQRAMPSASSLVSGPVEPPYPPPGFIEKNRKSDKRDSPSSGGTAEPPWKKSRDA